MSSGHVPPPEYYIALQDIALVKDGSSIWKKAKDAVIGSGSGHVLKGELLLGDGHSESGMFSGSLVSDPSKRIVCPKLYVYYVPNSEYKLIAPVKQLGDRLVLLNNKEKLNLIRKLQVNSNVWVSLPTNASGSTCRNGTIKYIGPIEGEEGHCFGIELKVAMGTCDGTYRKKRYFHCKDGYGIFLTAFNLNITSRAQANIMERRSVILSSDKSQTGRTFYEDDEVAVYSTGGKRVTGRAKWAYPVSDKDQLKNHVIGIETDKPNIPHSKIEGHHTNMGHLFKSTKDYTKHSYIAVPEVSVLKDEEDHGTPVDGQDPQLRSYDLIPEYPTNEQGLSQSILTTATKVAESENVSKCELINEHQQLEKASKEKLAEAFGVPPEELAAQEQEYKLLQNKKEEKDRRERLHGGVGNLPACSTHNPDHDPKGEQYFDAVAEPRRKSNNDLLKPTQNERQHDFRRQQSEGNSPNLSRKNPLQENPPTYPFDIGSIVEVNLNDKTVSGTVRWLGYLPKTPKVIAGVELDERLPDCGDGIWDGKKHFDCEKGYGMFILADKVKPHPRYVDVPKGRNPMQTVLRGRSEIIEDPVPRPSDKDLDRLFVGDKRGIQGHQNSCYLDSTLFAMFGLTDVFDDLILEEPRDDVGAKIVTIMSNEIISPLRMNGVVCYDHVMTLRHSLDKLNQMKGLTHAEQDPEEFLNLLFKHVLKVEKPFIYLQRPSGLDTEFFLQIFVEKSETTLFTMREILFKCMREQSISFTEAPRRLIIQLPRYGKEFKVYERIYPELHMDVSDICADYIPPGSKCVICGGNPDCCCHECGTKDSVFREGRHFMCSECTSTVHRHPDRRKHKPQMFDLKTASTRKVKLDLLSVVCIEKSHYVCFSRRGNRWFFFDSMADRTDDGFNLPSVQECPQIGEGLKDVQLLKEKPPTDLPRLLRRLVNDASICIYVDPEVEMYN